MYFAWKCRGDSLSCYKEHSISAEVHFVNEHGSNAYVWGSYSHFNHTNYIDRSRLHMRSCICLSLVISSAHFVSFVFCTHLNKWRTKYIMDSQYFKSDSYRKHWFLFKKTIYSMIHTNMNATPLKKLSSEEELCMKGVIKFRILITRYSNIQIVITFWKGSKRILKLTPL
jgi:hypothetical protein